MISEEIRRVREVFSILKGLVKAKAKALKNAQKRLEDEYERRGFKE